MPMPKPKPGEKESDFVSRFMGDAEMIKDYPDQKQRAAIAYDVYDRAKKKRRQRSESDEPVMFDRYLDAVVLEDAGERREPSTLRYEVVNPLSNLTKQLSSLLGRLRDRSYSEAAGVESRVGDELAPLLDAIDESVRVLRSRLGRTED